MRKVKRNIVEIDETLCDGCGLCVTSCEEGAIKIIDGKARLVSESLCDGFGACINICPKGALKIVLKEAEPFEEHGKEHVCEIQIANEGVLGNWPIQIRLIVPHSPQLRNQSLLIASDCVAYAYPDFHKRILDGKKLLIGCPKLDHAGTYVKKLKEIIESAGPKDITLAIMEIPCCRGFLSILKTAMDEASISMPIKLITVGRNGEILKEETLFLGRETEKEHL
ncbi:MAG: 4Fe-4S binding protein [Desulfobacterota bacterium]|nr:4Fe-4S binding protein [Thermodesulfobacteriota bacterium]MDW8002676.1 4Fe-4S binding protein [Deltaproteobacteria bacterium]